MDLGSPRGWLYRFAVFADPCHALMPLVTLRVPSGKRPGYITDGTGPGQSEVPCSCWTTTQLYFGCPHRGGANPRSPGTSFVGRYFEPPAHRLSCHVRIRHTSVARYLNTSLGVLAGYRRSSLRARGRGSRVAGAENVFQAEAMIDD